MLTIKLFPHFSANRMHRFSGVVILPHYDLAKDEAKSLPGHGICGMHSAFPVNRAAYRYGLNCIIPFDGTFAVSLDDLVELIVIQRLVGECETEKQKDSVVAQ